MRSLRIVFSDHLHGFHVLGWILVFYVRCCAYGFSRTAGFCRFPRLIFVLLRTSASALRRLLFHARFCGFTIDFLRSLRWVDVQMRAFCCSFSVRCVHFVSFFCSTFSFWCVILLFIHVGVPVHFCSCILRFSFYHSFRYIRCSLPLMFWWWVTCSFSLQISSLHGFGLDCPVPGSLRCALRLLNSQFAAHRLVLDTAFYAPARCGYLFARSFTAVSQSASSSFTWMHRSFRCCRSFTCYGYRTFTIVLCTLRLLASIRSFCTFVSRCTRCTLFTLRLRVVLCRYRVCVYNAVTILSLRWSFSFTVAHCSVCCPLHDQIFLSAVLLFSARLRVPRFHSVHASTYTDLLRFVFVWFWFKITLFSFAIVLFAFLNCSFAFVWVGTTTLPLPLILRCSDFLCVLILLLRCLVCCSGTFWCDDGACFAMLPVTRRCDTELFVTLHFQFHSIYLIFIWYSDILSSMCCDKWYSVFIIQWS